MNLDFTALRNIATEPPESPQTAFNDAEGKVIPLKDKEPQRAKYGPSEGKEQAAQLKMKYDREQAEHERNLSIYREYQSNIKNAGELRTEILKGARAGEPAVGLLLKAVKCISLMTSDGLFYSQIEGDIRSIYGAGLLEREPLEQELKDVQGRLEKLERASERETGDSKKRIEAAITAHRKRAGELTELLEKDPA